MLRKSSLPLLGLFDPNFLIIDYEYTLRVTASKATLAWFTGSTFINIINSGSNSRKYLTRLYEEKLRLQKFYGLPSTAIRHQYIGIRSKISSYVRKVGKAKTTTGIEFNFKNSFLDASVLLGDHNKIYKRSFLK